MTENGDRIVGPTLFLPPDGVGKVVRYPTTCEACGEESAELAASVRLAVQKVGGLVTPVTADAVLRGPRWCQRCREDVSLMLRALRDGRLRVVNEEAPAMPAASSG